MVPCILKPKKRTVANNCGCRWGNVADSNHLGRAARQIQRQQPHEDFIAWHGGSVNVPTVLGLKRWRQFGRRGLIGFAF